MQTWLDKLCEPLEHPQYPQIHGKLIIKDGQGRIIGKCAEGEIACQNNLGINYDLQDTVLYSDDLRKLGIPFDLLENMLPTINGYNKTVYSDIEDQSIDEYLWTLNDSGYTYPEIVEFLRITFEDAV